MIQIGKFTIEKRQDRDGIEYLFIQIIGDGEGMQCSEADLEKAISDFYHENF